MQFVVLQELPLVMAWAQQIICGEIKCKRNDKNIVPAHQGKKPIELKKKKSIASCKYAI